MARTRGTAAFAELAALCQSGSVGSVAQLAALDKIAVIMERTSGDAGVRRPRASDCEQLIDRYAIACPDAIVLPRRRRVGRR